MLFDDDDDDCDHTDKDVAKFFMSCDFNPESRTIVMFDVGCSVADLQLATAMLHNVGSVEACMHLLKAAWHLRNLTGHAAESEESRRWNRQHPVGTLVQFWIGGRNGETFLSRTASPAFDMAHVGPVLVVEDHQEAISLGCLQPSSVSHPEVMI